MKSIKTKKWIFGIGIFAFLGMITGVASENLQNNNNNNLILLNKAATQNNNQNNIFYSGINSNNWIKFDNTKKQYYVTYRYKLTQFWYKGPDLGWSDSVPKTVYHYRNLGWYTDEYTAKSERTVLKYYFYNNNQKLSFSNVFTKEIKLPPNKSDWSKQSYTIKTNWSGGLGSQGNNSYKITTSPGQQVFLIENSNVDGYNPATDAGNSGNGNDGMNIDLAGYHGGRDGLKTEIVINKSVSSNVLTVQIYLRVTTVNRGNGNKYFWDGLPETTISVTSITPSLNDVSDADFNSGLQKVLSNLSYVSDWSNSALYSRNWLDIQKFLTSKITAYVNSVNSKQNYHKNFNVDYNLASSTAGNVNLTVYYDSLNGSSGTVSSVGANQYKTAFNLTVPIKMLLSDKYYGNEAWNNLTFDTNKINYNENTGKITISSNSDIENSNPWYDLIKAPTPTSNQIHTSGTDSPTHPVYPNFGTFYINHEINLTYRVPPGQKGAMKYTGTGPGISVNGEINDSGDGIVFARLYDGRFDELKKNEKINPADIDKPTIWNIQINGNKNGASGTLMKMTFIIDAYSPTANISYRGWNPTAPIVSDWQSKWITQTLDNGNNNPLYKPILDPATGLGQEIVWLSGDDLNPKSFVNDSSILTQYNNSPDPIDNVGKLIYSAVNRNADGSLTPNVNTTNLNVPASSFGIIANAYVSPKGINEFVNPNQKLYRFTLKPQNVNGVAKLEIVSYKEIKSTGNSDLDYNDTTGIYLYVTENQSTTSNPNLTYTTSSVAIDRTITNQNFSQYVNQKLEEFAKANNLNVDNNVSHFWSSLQGQHLADFLFNLQGMKNDEIAKLDYSQIVSYWNIYVKNAVLLDENKTTPKYDLNNLALASIKTNSITADDLKKQVLTELQDQMNNLAGRLTIQKKADLAKVNKGYLWNDDKDKVNLVYGQDYYIDNLNSINWNSLANLSKTSRQQSINLKIVATTPNANLVAASSTNLKVINSLDFNNLYNLFNAQIPAWNANTKSLEILKQGIGDNVNSYLSSITGQKITNNDWYIKESDDQISNSLLPSGTAVLQIVSSDSSPYLINSTTITVNNKSTNLFDLRNIQIPKLLINSDDKGTIWQSVYNWVKDYVSKNYSSLILDTDYKIQILESDIDNLIDSFNNNSGDYTIRNILIPVDNKTQGCTNLIVNNSKVNDKTNNLPPTPNSNNPFAPQNPVDGGNGTNNPSNPNGPNGTGENQGYFSNKSNIAWVSTVATIGGIGLIIIVYGFIVRQIDNAETMSGIFFRRRNRKYWQQRALEEAEYQRKRELGIEDEDEEIDYYDDEGESDFSKGWTEFKRRFMPKRYAKQQAIKEQEEREQEEYLKRAKESYEKAKRDKDPFTPEERAELERLKAIAREERLKLKMEREMKDKGLDQEED